ncbi:MAG: protein-glutamine glutaminase family protein [Bacteriovoracales bacterium]|nr:protein-glutamine glutaminase family protein [Bacteriovoracales bacterium]
MDTMKTGCPFLFLLSILLSLELANANDTVRITVDPNDRILECSEEPSVNGYFCLNEDQNEYLIVRSLGGSDFVSDGVLGGKRRWYGIKKIESQDGILIYESNHYQNLPLSVPMDTPAYYEKSLMDHYLKLENDIMALEIPSHNNIAPSKKYARFLEKNLKGLKEERDEIFSNLKKNKINVSLDNGTQIACRRKPSFHTKKIQKMSDMCQVFSCGKDQRGLMRTLFFAMGGAPSHIIYLGKDGFYNGPKVNRIDKSSSAKEAIPLYIKKDFSSWVLPRIPETYSPPPNLLDQSDFFARMQSPFYEPGLRSLGSQCLPHTWKDFDLALKRYKEKLLEAELVQYITVINDMNLGKNLLQGYFIPKEQIPGNACLENGIYYDRNIYDKAKALAPSFSDQTISKEKARELFDYAKKMDDIPWDYKRDGCYARAHLTAKRFEELGVHVDKAWLRGDLGFEESDGTFIRWNFHVAPTVYVKSPEGQTQKFVIDPAFFDRPVPVALWAKTISRTQNIIETPYPFPENSTEYARSSLAFSNSDPYHPEDDLKVTEKEKIEKANKVMAVYRGDYDE